MSSTAEDILRAKRRGDNAVNRIGNEIARGIAEALAPVLAGPRQHSELGSLEGSDAHRIVGADHVALDPDE